MVMTRFCGDVHGKFSQYKNIIRNTDNSVQVGDMGVGFRYYDYNQDLVYAANPPHDYMMKRGARYIVGNHDRRATAKNDRKWIPCGTVENDVMYIGGATSIDKAYRTEGLNWWADEENSTEDLTRFVDTAIEVKPRIIVSHECPQSFADKILADHYKTKIYDPSRTRQALQSILELTKPEIWIFGHYHVDIDQVIDGTRFICLAELSWIDLDI